MFPLQFLTAMLTRILSRPSESQIIDLISIKINSNFSNRVECYVCRLPLVSRLQEQYHETNLSNPAQSWDSNSIAGSVVSAWYASVTLQEQLPCLSLRVLFTQTVTCAR